MKIQYKENQFTCSDGVQLFYRQWIPRDVARGVVIIVHGFSDHCGRYLNIVEGLIPRQIMIYGFDQRGHGHSPGQRGHVNKFTEFRDDLLTFTQMVSDQQPDIPLFLLGQSMGGLIVLDFGLHYPQDIDGVIALSPHLSDPPLSPILTALGRALSGIWPTLSISAGIDNRNLSRDPHVVQDFLADPLVHGKGTPRLLTELSKAVGDTNSNAVSFQPRLLITHGTADRMTNPEASRRFFEKAASASKAFIAYEGGYHEGHNDIHRERVVIDIGQWLEEQIHVLTQQPENRE